MFRHPCELLSQGSPVFLLKPTLPEREHSSPPAVLSGDPAGKFLQNAPADSNHVGLVQCAGNSQPFGLQAIRPVRQQQLASSKGIHFKHFRQSVCFLRDITSFWISLLTRCLAR